MHTSNISLWECQVCLDLCNPEVKIFTWEIWGSGKCFRCFGQSRSSCLIRALNSPQSCRQFVWRGSSWNSLPVCWHVSYVDAACWPVQPSHNSLSLKHFLVLMSEFRFDAFNTVVVQLHALLCSEHGASHFEQFVSLSIRYVVKKFTIYFIVHFYQLVSYFGALLYLLCFSHPSRETALWGGGWR